MSPTFIYQLHILNVHDLGRIEETLAEEDFRHHPSFALKVFGVPGFSDHKTDKAIGMVLAYPLYKITRSHSATPINFSFTTSKSSMGLV
jgi:hypothetical protein